MQYLSASGILLEEKFNSDKLNTKMKQFLCAAAALLLMSACESSKQCLPLEGTQWKLTEMEGTANPAFSAEADTFNITFDAEKKMVYGAGACNRLFGPYVLTAEDGVDIERLAATMMACPNLDLENRFTKLLEESDSYKIDGDVLTLFDDGRKLLVFKGTTAASVPAEELTPAQPVSAADSVKTTEEAAAPATK